MACECIPFGEQCMPFQGAHLHSRPCSVEENSGARQCCRMLLTRCLLLGCTLLQCRCHRCQLGAATLQNDKRHANQLARSDCQGRTLAYCTVLSCILCCHALLVQQGPHQGCCRCRVHLLQQPSRSARSVFSSSAAQLSTGCASCTGSLSHIPVVVRGWVCGSASCHIYAATVSQRLMRGCNYTMSTRCQDSFGETHCLSHRASHTNGIVYK